MYAKPTTMLPSDDTLRTYAVEYGDSWATASNSSRKAMGNCVSPNKITPNGFVFRNTEMYLPHPAEFIPDNPLQTLVDSLPRHP